MKRYIITLLAVVMSMQAGLALANTPDAAGKIKSIVYKISDETIAPLPWHGNSGNGPIVS